MVLWSDRFSMNMTVLLSNSGSLWSTEMLAWRAFAAKEILEYGKCNLGRKASSSFISAHNVKLEMWGTEDAGWSTTFREENVFEVQYSGYDQCWPRNNRNLGSHFKTFFGNERLFPGPCRNIPENCYLEGMFPCDHLFSLSLFLNDHLSWNVTIIQNYISSEIEVFRFNFDVVCSLLHHFVSLQASGGLLGAWRRLVTNLTKQFRIGSRTDCLQMRSLQCYLTLVKRNLY